MHTQGMRGERIYYSDVETNACVGYEKEKYTVLGIEMIVYLVHEEG